MSPLEKAFHKIRTSKPWAFALLTPGLLVVAAATILVILAAHNLSQAEMADDATSIGHASPSQTPGRRRSPIVVRQLPTLGSTREPSQTDNQPASTCPSMKMSCPGPVSEGTEVTFAAQWKGGTRGADPKYVWSASAGKIIKGQNTPTMTLSTEGARGKTVTVTLELVGFGKSCTRTCSFRVNRTKEDTPVPVTPTPFPPTPTVTTTPTPVVTHPVTPAPTTPTPSITQTPTPTPSTPELDVVVTTSPPVESPTPPLETLEVTPSPSTEGTATIWPWILGIVSAFVAAAYALGRFWLRGGILSGGEYKTQAIEIERAENGLTAAIVAAKKKEEEDEEVRCTVFAPYEAAPGDGFLVQAFAHLADQVHLLSEIAKQASRDTGPRGSATLGDIVRGEKLGFDLDMSGLEIDEPSQSLDWLGKTDSVIFGVTVPKTFEPRSINCKLSVSRHGVPIGHIKFNFKISAEPQAAKETTLNSHQNFVAYKLAFISYASADRSEVMKRVQMLDLAKIRYFQDLLSLEAGKEWEPLIYRYIDQCDVFYLFWSTAAKKSKWVKKEVERALKRRGDKFDAPPEIMGIPIEGPPPVKPTRSLAKIFFDSKFLYFINPKDGKG